MPTLFVYVAHHDERALQKMIESPAVERLTLIRRGELLMLSLKQGADSQEVATTVKRLPSVTSVSIHA